MLAIDKQKDIEINDFDVFVNALEERFDFSDNVRIAVRWGSIWREYEAVDGELVDVEQLRADGDLDE